MTSKPKTLSRKSDPPLVIKESVEVDSKTGAKVPVTRVRRGLLSVETRHYNAKNARAMGNDPPSEESWAHFCDGLRDQLEKWGLPSDRTPLVRVGKDEWRPVSPGEQIPAQDQRVLWVKAVETLTEPLSDRRQIGQLLWDVIQLLNRDGIKDHLWHIGRVMNSFHMAKVAGRINSLAHAGITARQSRAAGPIARRERTPKVQRIVLAEAQRFWRRRPNYRNDASNTAAHIAKDVNAGLRKAGLLKLGKKLSNKTIADYIRVAVRAEKFQTG